MKMNSNSKWLTEKFIEDSDIDALMEKKRRVIHRIADNFYDLGQVELMTDLLISMEESEDDLSQYRRRRL